MVDIFSVPQKTSINCTLKSKSIAIVGKSKAGKSTLAAQAPRPIFLMTENGGEGLVGFTPIAIASWSDFKMAVNQLCTPKARENFDTVVIDTYTNLILLLDKYVGQKITTEKENYDFGSEADYGRGVKVMKNELGIQLQKLANQGYLLLNIIHAEDKTDFKTGRDYIGTSLSNSLYGVAEKFCDQIVYLRRDENKKGEIEHNIWFTSKGGFAGAGGRFKVDTDCVPCDYQHLESTLINAMNKIADNKGATKVVESVPSVIIDVKEAGDLNIVTLKEEFDKLTEKIMEMNENGVEQIQSIIANILGPGKKVSNLIAGQEELLADIIENLKQNFNIVE